MSDDNLENSANCGMPDDAVVETCEGCEACEWPQAFAWEQLVMGGSALMFVLSGWRAIKRNRPRWLPVWLAGLLGWATIPKYFICARCENYGKSCDFFYGGRYAARLFKKSDKEFNAAGYLAEGSTLGVFQFMPLIAARRDFKSLALYGLAAALFQSALVKFCCIDCVRYAKDPWKAAYCPTWKMVVKLAVTEAQPEEPSDEATQLKATW